MVQLNRSDNFPLLNLSKNNKNIKVKQKNAVAHSSKEIESEKRETKVKCYHKYWAKIRESMRQPSTKHQQTK